MNVYLLTLRGYLSWVISNKHIIVHLLLRHKKNESFISIQCQFCTHFNVSPHGAIQNWKSIQMLVSNLKNTASVLQIVPSNKSRAV